MAHSHPIAYNLGETAVEAAPLPDIVKMDIRVGKILSCEKHPDADRCAWLYDTNQ